LTPFNLEEYILLISKPIQAIFAALNTLSVELQNPFEDHKK
jgi:hypothetical protein